MKKIFGLVVIITILVIPAASFAAEFRSGDQPSIRADEQVADDLYIAGGTVTSAGSVPGDLIAGGGNILISGNVGADVVAGGGNVNILSNVGDDVRVAGGTIVISGSVGGDVIAGGGQITISGPGVAGDAMIGGGNVRIDAPVAGMLSFGGKSIYINSPISGDIKIEADKVTLGSSAVISGNMTYKANSPMVTESGAVVNGKVIFSPLKQKTVSTAAVAAIFSAFLIWKFFALLACALLFGLVFRRYSRELIKMAQIRPLHELGIGVVAFAAMPVISILLLVTLVAIPIGVIGLLGFAILLIFSFIVTPIIVGSFVYRYFSKKDLEVNWKTILTGVIVCKVLGLIPFVGWLAYLLLFMITFGCIVRLKLRLAKEWR